MMKARTDAAVLSVSKAPDASDVPERGAFMGATKVAPNIPLGTFQEKTRDIALLRNELTGSDIVSPRTRRRLPKQIGFKPGYPLAYRAYNVVAALLILTGALPFLLVISLALLATQGREIFYGGPRLGKDLKIFRIYKFRTLNTAAAARITGDRTLPSNSGLETPLGKFLRDTRLDELPQILNVLRGDMNLCGPRPVRPEIAAIERARIPGYDMRFTVKPGLVGPAQALMSHGTSKRIRALFNNTACRRPVSMKAELTLLSAIGFAVLRRSAAELYVKIRHKVWQGWSSVRSFINRIVRTFAGPNSHDSVWVALPCVPSLQKVELHPGQILEIPSLAGQSAMIEGPTGVPVTLVVALPGGGTRRARVTLKPAGTPGRYAYAATTAASGYIIERYLLGLTVLGPTRRRQVASPHNVRFG